MKIPTISTICCLFNLHKCAKKKRRATAVFLITGYFFSGDTLLSLQIDQKK